MPLDNQSMLPDASFVPQMKRTKKPDPNGYKIVSVRLREAEYACFSEEVKSLGLTNNLALRIAARRVAGFIEIDKETRRTLEKAVKTIGELSTNLANLNDKYAKSGAIDMQTFTESRNALANEFATLDTHLAQILNVSQRRIDGRFLLKNASTGPSTRPR